MVSPPKVRPKSDDWGHIIEYSEFLFILSQCGLLRAKASLFYP